MNDLIYTFSFLPDWMKLTNEISQIDRFDAFWSSIEKREGSSLKQLKEIATVRSVGASTRIEGSKMTDKEVELLIKKIDISRLEERDQQEVVGYFKALDLISESFRDITITEGNVKNLHKILLSRSTKDDWHRGNYKQHSNAVEARYPDGSKQTLFHTMEPGFATEDAMDKLIRWYQSDKKTHPLVKAALFVYDFLSIHPFQDGNGRLSRLLTTLLLLRQGYSWIQYVSFEHEIESRKGEYYRELMQCQSNRPGEDVYPWVSFFLDCLKNIQNLLIQKFNTQTGSGRMSPREKVIFSFIETSPGSRSSQIAEKLDIPLPTVKRILTDMVTKKLLSKHSVGAGTNYSVENIVSVRKDLQFSLTEKKRKKEFKLMGPGSFVEIRKIILTPLFEWIRPDDWAIRLINQGMSILVTCAGSTGLVSEQSYPISSYNDPDLFQPVFTLKHPLKLPHGPWGDLWGKSDPFIYEYPITIMVTLLGSVPVFDFDVQVVYDEA